MKGFQYTDSEIIAHADWLLFGPAIDMTEMIASKNRSRFLDAGCGTGDFHRMLQYRGVDVDYFGLDISYGNIRSGQMKNKTGNWVRGDICHLPFCENAFDIVISYGVIQALPDAFKAVRELNRISKSLCMVEVAETPVGVNSFSEVGQDGFDQRITLYHSGQLLSRFTQNGIAPPDKIIARSVKTDPGLAKPNYRNIPYLIRSIYIWGIPCPNEF